MAIVVVIEENGRRNASASLKFNPQEALRGIRQNWGLLYMTITRTWGIGTALLNHMIGVAGMKKLDKV